jgi:peptidoglycan/LPS O-acetylase OafA/YrhL
MQAAQIRQQIDFLRFFMIVGLVFLHYGSFPGTDLSPFRGFQETDHPVATFINSYILFIFLSAVPVLSAISGYLFFKDCNYSRSFYLQRYRSRTHSILLPMISWNVIALIVFIIIRLATPGSPMLDVIKYDLENLSLPEIVNAILGITRHPINFQFWFLRDLFLVVLCAPLLGFLIARAPWVGLGALFVVWIGNFDLGIFFRTDILFFFYVGGLIQARRVDVSPLSPRFALAALALYLSLVAVRTVAEFLFPTEDLFENFILAPLTRLLRVLGVVVFWSIAPLLMRTLIGRWIAQVGALAFFLHAVHWPMNQAVKQAIGAIWPGNNSAVLLLNYFGTTFLTVVLALVIARFLHAVAPNIFRHLSGGRSGIWTPPVPRPALP